MIYAGSRLRCLNSHFTSSSTNLVWLRPSGFSALQLYTPALCLVTGLMPISASGLKIPERPSFRQMMVAGGLLSATHLRVTGSFSSSR